MTDPKVPMDHLKKKYPVQLKQAVSLQSANLVQKAMLDNTATKIIMVLGIVQRASGDSKTRPIIADRIQAVLSMDAAATAEARTAFVYPDERIQAAIDKAVVEITAILLEDV